MRKTQRGFIVYSEFHDLADQEIRVQESSLATQPACWVFIHPGEKTQDGFTPYRLDPVTGYKSYPAIHLSVAQAKRLAKNLEKFIAKNRFTE